MSGPWERYSTPAGGAEAGPWAKYGKAPAAPPTPADVDQQNLAQGVPSRGNYAPPQPEQPQTSRIGDALQAGARTAGNIAGSVAGGVAGAAAGATDFADTAIKHARGQDTSKVNLRGPDEGAAAATGGINDLMDKVFGKQSQRSQDMQAAPGRVLDKLGVRPEALMGPGLGAGAATLPMGLQRAGQLAAPPMRAAGDFMAPGFVAAGEKAMAPVRAAGRAVAADSDTLGLARKAQEQGIPLRPDMLSKNKLARMAGEASEQVPFSGSQAKVRQEAFNKALIRQIGGDEKATRLTPDVYSAAMKKSGSTIGDIAAKTPVKSFQPKLQEFLADHETHTADVRQSLAAYAREIETQTRNGVIDGTAYKRINSKLSRQARSTSNGDLKQALGDMQDLLHDELQANVKSMSDLKTLQGARAMYAKGKTLEPLVAKSADGHISPAGLMGRVNSNASGKTAMAMGNGGEMGDLARIGQRFLKEPNSSGTAERGAVYGALAGGTALHPAAAAGAVGAANLYNRMGPALVKRILGDSPP